MRSQIVFSLLLTSVLAFRPAFGQEETPVASAPVEVIGGRAPTRLEFDVQAGTLKQFSPSGALKEEWSFAAGVTPIAQVSRNRPMSLEIINSNPLLYSYELEAITVRSKTGPGCRVSAGAFLTDGLVAGSTVFSGLTEGAFEAGGLADLVDLDLEEIAGLRGAELTSMQLDSYLQGFRAAVVAAVDRSGELVEILESVDDSLSLIARRAEIQPLRQLSNHYLAGLDRFERGLGTPVEAAEAVERVLTSSGGDLDTFRGLAGALRGGDQSLAATPAARTILGWADKLDGLAARAVSQVPRFQAALLQLSQANRRETVRFAIAPAEGDSRRLTITVRRTDEFQQLFRARAGQVSMYTTPKPSLRCSVGVGVLWTSPAADYSIDEDGLIEDLSRGDDLAVSPALLFEVGLPQMPFLSIHGGIGAGTARVPDLFAGGSFRLSPQVGLAVGAVWRRVRALPAGTAVGDELPDGVGLSDFEHEFDRQFYWGITFTR